MQLQVIKVSPSKSGKALRVQGGDLQWYGAKKDSGIAEGMTIEAEVEDGQFGKWINKYKQVNAAPQALAVTGNGSSSSSQPAGAAPIWANFVSNQVAHAIAAGRIDDPEQIKVWAAAAKAAFVELL